MGLWKRKGLIAAPRSLSKGKTFSRTFSFHWHSWRTDFKALFITKRYHVQLETGRGKTDIGSSNVSCSNLLLPMIANQIKSQ